MSSNPSKIISLQELINAQVDAYKLELIMNEAPWVEVTTRLGRKCYSIATIQAIIDDFRIRADEKIADIEKELDQAIGKYDSVIASEIAELQEAIRIAAAAGAGANGWIDKLVQTWSGRTQEAKNKDFVSAKDFGVVDSASDNAIRDAISYAITNNTSIIFDFDVVIKIPTHVGTLQSAVDHITSISNRKFTLLIESGHQIISGINISDGDYSNFTIESVDAEISVSDTYIDKYIVKAERAKAPVFNILINGKHLVDTMIDIQHNSEISIGNRKGVRNPKVRGVYLNGSSRGYMNYLISTGATLSGESRNLWVSRNSSCECGGAIFEGAGDYNVWVSRSSIVYGESATFKNAGYGAIGSSRHSIASFNLATITDCASAARCFGGHIYLNDAKATGLSVGGLYSEETGCISARNMTLIASTSSTTLEYGILAEKASIISAESAVVDGFKLVGIFARSASTVNANNATVRNIATGALIDARGASTITVESAKLSGATTAIRATNASRVSAVSSNISDILTNSLYALNGSSVDLSSAKIGKITTNNIAVYRGSNVIVQSTMVDNVAITPSDTNVSAFDTWYARGTVYSN